jgi:hypothetical protein
MMAGLKSTVHGLSEHLKIWGMVFYSKECFLLPYQDFFVPDLCGCFLIGERAVLMI